MAKKTTSARAKPRASQSKVVSGRKTPVSSSSSTPVKRGFAAMSLNKRKEIARKGVRARRAA